MKVRTAVLAAALMAACAPTTTAPASSTANGAPAQPSAEAAMLPAPTPVDVSIRINAAQDGQQVVVPVNQRFAIELVGTPTAGYQWTPAQLPPFIVRAGDASGPTMAAQNQPGYTGGNHWQVTIFAATGPGEGQILMEERRPWETSEPPAHSFRVSIVAR